MSTPCYSVGEAVKYKIGRGWASGLVHAVEGDIVLIKTEGGNIIRRHHAKVTKS